MLCLNIIILILQLVVMGVFIYFLSGRLMGTKLNMIKLVLSAVLSVVLTTFVFWYSYFRHTNYLNQDVLQQVSNIGTLVWFGSMLLIAMLFYLIFELFDPKQESDFQANQENALLKIRSNYYRKRRLAQVFRIAFKQGIGKALQYKRSYENDRYIAVVLRNILEETGGIFIKFGQVLSTRKDILPPVFIEEFSKLQQNVRPMPTDEVQQIIRREFGEDPSVYFKYFAEQPFAAGSIGQVHRAQLRETNEEVVVKVLRSDVTRIMNKDLDILLHFAMWLEEESTWAENLGFYQLATGFANGLREEINFDIERRNMEQITNALKNSGHKVRIPKVYPELSNRKILVMEYMKGVPITKSAPLLKQRGIEQQQVLSELYGAFLEQLLVAGVFHADPHPGNVYVMEDTGEPVFLDFGAAGRIGPLQNRGLRTLLIGIARNDVKIMAQGLENLVTDGNLKNRASLEQDLSQLLISIQYMDKISTETLVQRLFDIMKSHELKLYPMVSMALRALITIDGTLSSVNPQYDIFNEAKRFSIENKEDLAQAVTFDELKTTAVQEMILLMPQLRDIPRRVDQIVQNFERGEMTVKANIFADAKNATFISHWLSLLILLTVAVTFGFISVALLAIAQFINGMYAVYLNTAAFVGLFLSSVILVRLSVQALRYSKRI
ncbi:ABC1 kinase family protein [Kurthia huakuii]|uniref:ABC1 kinase family protein n=1 Tax=Kurthia huakuii TaxID=1421019 RepID=UPI001F3F42B3|nr:AarF/UbiB family protein [Kurthia huakuii]